MPNWFAEHVAQFASVGLVLARCWALLGHIAECTAPRWVVSAPSSPMLGRCWSCWAMLGQRRDRIALILSHLGPRWSKDARQTTAGGQHSSSQRSKDTRRAWEKSRDTFWHSSKATNWDTHQTVAQVSQHSSKQTWQEVSQHSSRHSKDTNLGHLGQQPVQQGHPPNTAAFATQPLQQGLILGHRPKQASQCSKDSAWESSQCSKRGQTRGQVSQHSSICRRGMGCPPGMSPQQQQPAPYSLLAGTETASGQQQPPLGSSLPADSQTHGRTNRPTNMGGSTRTTSRRTSHTCRDFWATWIYNHICF